jgi:ATP-binding cassette subfamily F protein uup
VKALSGGERNRLLLARLFTRPANVLVLDEPTNDLDLETLELLEAQLVEWPGTLLLVSHDRAFLDNVVTSTFVFEGGGVVQEYVGGYTDWVRQSASRAAPFANSARESNRSAGPGPQPTAASPRRRLSYMEQRELDALPARIEALEEEQRILHSQIAGPDFYKERAEAIEAALARADTLEQELTALYGRWTALDERIKN